MKVRFLISAVLSLAGLFARPGISSAETLSFTFERNGVIVTVREDGELILSNLSGDEQPSSRLPLTGNVTDLDTNDDICVGVTDRGEIFISKDGRNWDVKDFNKMYEGYYEKIRFVGVAAGKGSVAVAGITETNAPAVYISTRGTVWSARSLTYFQGEELFELTELPVGITADLERDEFVLECTDDVFFILPPCSHCNRLEYRGQ